MCRPPRCWAEDVAQLRRPQPNVSAEILGAIATGADYTGPADSVSPFRLVIRGAIGVRVRAGSSVAATLLNAWTLEAWPLTFSGPATTSARWARGGAPGSITAPLQELVGMFEKIGDGQV